MFISKLIGKCLYLTIEDFFFVQIFVDKLWKLDDNSAAVSLDKAY